jgi:hypothetical protein
MLLYEMPVSPTRVHLMAVKKLSAGNVASEYPATVIEVSAE